jgi:4,5-DOPA dioxygenase extradiol
MTEASARMPSVFVAHGSPLLLDDAKWVAELRAWADALPRPQAILAVCAHWVQEPIAVSSVLPVKLVYDFAGFPRKYYEVKYAPPGPHKLRTRVHELLDSDGPVFDAPRGLDHGVYVPLIAMYPDADIPVLELSMPTLEMEPLVELGRKLAPLRDEGVLIMGSGFLVHNLREVSFRGNVAPPKWATAFDGWAKLAIEKRDVDALVHFHKRGPDARMALPTVEHFVPLGVALGASLGTDEPVTFPITGFAYGSMTKRSVQFG